MKIKIKNVFEPDKAAVMIYDLEDDKKVDLEAAEKGDPHLTIRCKTKSGFPVFINMAKTACLAIEFSEDN